MEKFLSALELSAHSLKIWTWVRELLGCNRLPDAFRVFFQSLQASYGNQPCNFVRDSSAFYWQ